MMEQADGVGTLLSASRADTRNEIITRIVRAIALEWGISTRWATVIWVMPFVVALSGVLAALGGKDVYRWYTTEDGPVENLQVLFYFLAFLVALRIVWRFAVSRDRAMAALFGLFCLGSVVMIGEELTWGQRIFGWETPYAMLIRSKQAETNLHTICGVEFAFKWVQMLVGAYGAFLPLLVWRWRPLAAYRQTLARLVPPFSVIHYFLFMFLWRTYRNLIPRPRTFYIFFSEYNEVIELILAMGFFLFSLYQLRKLEATTSPQLSGEDVSVEQESMGQ